MENQIKAAALRRARLPNSSNYQLGVTLSVRNFRECSGNIRRLIVMKHWECLGAGKVDLNAKVYHRLVNSIRQTQNVHHSWVVSHIVDHMTEFPVTNNIVQFMELR
jgi:hypothetical protein